MMKKKYLQALVNGFLMCLGAAIPFLVSLVWITFIWCSFRQFYIQTIYWQIVRWPMPLSQRLTNVFQYLAKFAPLLLMSGLGSLFIHEKSINSRQNLFHTTVLASNIICLVFLFNNFFLHYLYYLSPYMALLSAYGFKKTWSFMNSKNHKVKQQTRILAMILFIATTVSFTIQLGAQLLSFQDFPDERIHQHLGEYISKITEPDDRIWTSEGAIAVSYTHLTLPTKA